jgi:hypothetical protein
MHANRDAWKGAHEAVQGHYNTFNKQLEMMVSEEEDVASDPESPLFQPIRDYAE